MTEKSPSAAIGAYGRPTSPGIMVLSFLILTFSFSSIYWYHIALLPAVPANATLLLLFTLAAMWCPAMAAIITRLFYQRNLKGFGFGVGKPTWLVVGFLLPVAVGLLMFGTAWLFGIAPFNTGTAAAIFSVSFIPVFVYGIAFNLFAAAGEEIGWRGLLVPELSRTMGFTKLALLSSAIWTVWHFPLIFFGTYHGAGPIWYSLAVFVPSVMGAGLILAWLRLRSGSIWGAVLFHGFWNYFIQQFYPALTVTTPAGDMMLGEFGWFVAIVYVLMALVFWHFRDRLPELPVQSAVAEKTISRSGNQPPDPTAPTRGSGSRRMVMLAICAIILVAIALAAGVMLSMNYLPGPGGDQGSGNEGTPVITPSQAFPQEGTPAPLPALAPLVTAVEATPAPVLIPPTGVWVRVAYPGSFTGTLGTAADQRPVADSGDKFYVVATATGIVKASIQKTDGSGQELTVDVYKDGALVESRSTTVPKGTVEVQVDLKPPATTLTTPA